ncbi:hypothetical protein [Calothrix sp. NIES-2098]|uniref:hypothetical protein n=1 Tax=Calothrix sp. NIES-2098 TaxID=1954171 RepID=UPI0030D8C0F1
MSNQKNSPVGGSLPGELVIRVHLPFNCSPGNFYNPEKFPYVLSSLGSSKHKKAPSWFEPTRGVSYQGASTI